MQNSFYSPYDSNYDVINHRYKKQKLKAVELYDFYVSSALEHPSPSIQQLPEIFSEINQENNTNKNSNETDINSTSQNQNQNYSSHKLLMSTHITSTSASNQLLFANVKIPNFSKNYSARQKRNFLNTFESMDTCINISHTVNVGPQPTNRSRFCPSNPSLIATKFASHTLQENESKLRVALFDCSSNSTQQKPIELCGHTRSGYGLCQNENIEGLLLSGSDDGLICIQDIKASNTLTSNSKYEPKLKYNIKSLHTPLNNINNANDDNAVEDVQQSPHSPHIFGAVCENGTFLLFDTRSKVSTKPSHSIDAHKTSINSLSFNPFYQNILLTGSIDSTIGLWDTRNLSKRIHTFGEIEIERENESEREKSCGAFGHVSSVYKVAQSPHLQTVFASCSSDRRVLVQDCARLYNRVFCKDKEEEKNHELIFIHGGHTEKVGDFSQSPVSERTIASVSDNAIVQVQQMAGGSSFFDDFYESEVEQNEETLKENETKGGDDTSNCSSSLAGDVTSGAGTAVTVAAEGGSQQNLKQQQNPGIPLPISSVPYVAPRLVISKNTNSSNTQTSVSTDNALDPSTMNNVANVTTAQRQAMLPTFNGYPQQFFQQQQFYQPAQFPTNILPAPNPHLSYQPSQHPPFFPAQPFQLSASAPSTKQNQTQNTRNTPPPISSNPPTNHNIQFSTNIPPILQQQHSQFNPKPHPPSLILRKPPDNAQQSQPKQIPEKFSSKEKPKK